MRIMRKSMQGEQKKNYINVSTNSAVTIWDLPHSDSVPSFTSVFLVIKRNTAPIFMIRTWSMLSLLVFSHSLSHLSRERQIKGINRKNLDGLCSSSLKEHQWQITNPLHGLCAVKHINLPASLPWKKSGIFK